MLRAKIFHIRYHLSQNTQNVLEATVNEWLASTKLRRSDIVDMQTETHFITGKPGDEPVVMYHLIHIYYEL